MDDASPVEHEALDHLEQRGVPVEKSPEVAPAVRLLHADRPTVLDLEGGRAVAMAAAPSPTLVGHAREVTGGACRRWRVPDPVAADAALVVDELVSNAVRHAGTRVEVHLRHQPDDLVIAVHDEDPDFDPGWWDRSPPDDDEPRTGGYGLPLIRALSDHCGGYQHRDGGKVLWATLPLPSPDQGVHDGQGQHAPPGASRPSDVEDLPPDAAEPAVQHVIPVHAVRRVIHRQRGQWRLDLSLRWDRAHPNRLTLTLHSTPPHPALPEGQWRTAVEALATALQQHRNLDPDIRLHHLPDERGVLLELADGQRAPQVLHVSRTRLERFLTEITTATGDAGSSPARSRGGHERS